MIVQNTIGNRVKMTRLQLKIICSFKFSSFCVFYILLFSTSYVESSSGSSTRTCAVLRSGEHGFEDSSLTVGDGKVFGNIGDEYVSASQSWNTSGGYWNIAIGCELNACEDVYLTGKCSVFGGTNPSISNSKRWLSASCKCSKQCQCSDIHFRRDVCGRAYLQPNGCNTCDSQYLELEGSNSNFPERFKDKITSLLIKPGCNIEIYEEEDYEGNSKNVQEFFNQNWKGTIGSYECQCDDYDDAEYELWKVHDKKLQKNGLRIPETLEEIVSQLRKHNYNHPGLLAAFSSIVHGRSPKNAYILVLGSTGSGKSSAINFLLNDPDLSLAGDSKSTTADIIEFRIPIPLAELGVSNSEIRIIDTPGMGDTEGVENDAVFLASLDDYLSGHEELKNRKPNLVLIFHKFNDNRFSGPGAKFTNLVRGLNSFRTRITDENYSNVLFAFSHYSSEISKVQSNPFPKLMMFKEVIEEFSLFPKPILTSVIENYPKDNELLMVNDNYVLPNNELLPSNLLDRIDTITTKGHDEIGKAIISSAFWKRRSGHLNVSESVFNMVDPNHPKVAKYLSILFSASSSFTTTEISRQLAITYGKMPGRLKSKCTPKTLEYLQKYLNLRNIHLLAEVPLTNGAILDLLEGIEKNEGVWYLLEKGLNLKAPVFQSGLVTGNCFSDIKASILPKSPYKLDVLKASEIGYSLPGAIKVNNASSNFNSLQTFDTKMQLVNYVATTFGIDISQVSEADILAGMQGQFSQGHFIKDTQCPKNMCSFVASRYYQLYQFGLEERTTLNSLNQEFIRRVRSLTPFKNSNFQSVEMWNNFFNDYGTHVVKSALVGGRIDIRVKSPAEIAVQSNKDKLFKTVEFAENLNSLISGEKIDHKRILPKGVSYSLSFHGGDPSYHTTDLTALSLEDASKIMRNWKGSLKYNPVVIPTEFIPIDRVAQVVGSAKSNFIREAGLHLHNGTLSYVAPPPDPNKLKQELLRQQRELEKRLRLAAAAKRRLEQQEKREKHLALVAQRNRERELKRLKDQQKRAEQIQQRKLEQDRKRISIRQQQEVRRAQMEDRRRERVHQRQLAIIRRRTAAETRKAQNELRRQLRQQSRRQG